MAMKKVEVFLSEEQIEALKKIDRSRSYAIRECVCIALDILNKKEAENEDNTKS